MVGHEQAARPVVVLSADVLNEHSGISPEETERLIEGLNEIVAG